MESVYIERGKSYGGQDGAQNPKATKIPTKLTLWTLDKATQPLRSMVREEEKVAN